MSNLIKKAKHKADDEFNFREILSGVKGVIAELLDGAFIGAALEFVASKIPDEYEDDFEALLQAYVDDNYGELSEDLLKRLNEIVDLPGLNEAQEAIIFKHIYQAIIEIVQARNGSATADSVGGGGPGGDPDPDPPNT